MKHIENLQAHVSEALREEDVVRGWIVRCPQWQAWPEPYRSRAKCVGPAAAKQAEGSWQDAVIAMLKWLRE